jgi:peptide/nickel transport system permease protein
MSTPVSPASRLLAWRPRNLAGRMARWGVVIVIVYLLIALLTPLFTHLGLLPDVNAGLDNPIYAPPSWQHWCGTDRLGRDVCSRTLAGSGVALQVVAIALVSALVKACLMPRLRCVWCTCRSISGWCAIKALR